MSEPYINIEYVNSLYKYNWPTYQLNLSYDIELRALSNNSLIWNTTGKPRGILYFKSGML